MAGRIPIPTIFPGGGGTLDYLVVFAPLRLLVWTPFLAVARKPFARPRAALAWVVLATAISFATDLVGGVVGMSLVGGIC